MSSYKLTDFIVKIVDNQQVFNPCDEIALVVQLKVLEPVRVRGIHLKVYGQCYVYWEERRSAGDSNSTHYEGKDNFIAERKVLWGQEGYSPEEQLLPAGEYTFTEQYILPKNIPSSYEGEYGYVRYWAKAKVYRSRWKLDVTSEEAHFSINGVSDLNEYPEAQEVVIRSEQRTVCCWCCKHGSYNVVFRLDHRGFVVTGPVIVMAEIVNNTSNYLTATAYLVMKTTYKASDNERTSKVIIAEATHDSIEPDESDVWNDPILIPPETHLTNLGASTLIDVNYEIQFLLNAAGCNCDDIKFKERIILGTVPLNTTLTSSINTAIEDCSQHTPLMPPPSYAECMTPGSPHFVKQDSLPSYSDVQSYPLQQEISRT
ncbi:arrestin domain-containing protein 3 [Patella vulgata]|uniref:arrestin domain-containing protein 3 n=1 Tax=Patella vulgata TaxID=6465 RepID=UPI00217FF74B|nr:arrestin domain-containing protein 3 [Patella vulgata]